MPHSAYDDPRLTTVGLLAEVWAGLRALIAPQLVEHDLNETEFEVLLRLARTPGHRLRMSDLAAQTSLSTSGITRVVDRLERDGLVHRQSCATDRRGYWAVLTERGDQRIAGAVVGHLELIDHWVTRPLSDSQLGALTEALRVIRDGVRPQALSGVHVGDGAGTGPTGGLPTGELTSR